MAFLTMNTVRLFECNRWAAISVVLIFAFSMGCKKEVSTPRLSFSKEEKQWFIYEKGQQYKFRNDIGDSLVYTVTDVSFKTNVPEYRDTGRTELVSYSDSYFAALKSVDDSIIIYFYKSMLFDANPDKMQHTVRWFRMTNQFAYFPALEDQTPFYTKTVNGKTYSKVTDAFSLGNSKYPFTRYSNAFYDQKAGFIAIIDVMGKSWVRE